MNKIQTWMTTAAAKRLALYVIFTGYGLIQYLHSPGDDLSSSYIACRLLSHDEGTHLYDFHPQLFNVVDSAAWISAAADVKFTGFLHPYVQTPLWAWALQPICTQLPFTIFSSIFLGMALLSLAATIEIVARAWAGIFLRPLPLTILLFAITLTTPFIYAMWLVQTHALFLMLTVAALYLAHREHPLKAGVLLALACAIKLTPGMLLIYWLVGKRYRAALWFVAGSLLLAALTAAAAGSGLTIDYVRSMQRVSNVLLVSFNNQSLAAWLAYSKSMQSELFNWRMLPLTPGLKITSLAASIFLLVLLGWMSRFKQWAGASAAMALIVMTIFSPIAWTHYFLALIPAVMVLVNAGGVLSWVVIIITFVLNSFPVAIFPMAAHLSFLTLVRSHFISAIILMFATALICFRSDINNRNKPGNSVGMKRSDPHQPPIPI